MNVDLPEPDGPMTAVNVARPKSAVTPRSAGTAVSPVPYVFVRSRAAAAAVVSRGPERSTAELCAVMSALSVAGDSVAGCPT